MFKFSSDRRTNLPKSQIQNVVVAKLATVLQKVQVTDRSRSPPQSARNNQKDRCPAYHPPPVQKLENDPPGELPTTMSPYLAITVLSERRRSPTR